MRGRSGMAFFRRLEAWGTRRLFSVRDGELGSQGDT